MQVHYDYSLTEETVIAVRCCRGPFKKGATPLALH
ncbi:protein of unknown function [Shewanella benthica]|uniref:Uncharacterized protein n=1 Tax=Shewanella benthica TaxID=43661 RepID=A0A330MCX1_9GAMM|nr:protein of unknown function [Shewanella benthica]